MPEDLLNALAAIADRAMARRTGARGLRARLEEVLMSVMDDLPSRGDVAACVITREVVLEHVHPTLVPHGAVVPARRERREKSAEGRARPSPQSSYARKGSGVREGRGSAGCTRGRSSFP